MRGYCFLCCKASHQCYTDNQLAQLQASAAIAFHRGCDCPYLQCMDSVTGHFRRTLPNGVVVLAGLWSFAQLFSLLFSLYNDICSIFMSALWSRHLQTSAVPPGSRWFYFHISRLLVVVLTVPHFSRICECLVQYFDPSSSDSRNGSFSGSWLHPGWCLGSLLLPELCILMMTLSLWRFYLERLCCILLCLGRFFLLV